MGYIVIGIDPGPTCHGVAVLYRCHMRGSERWRFLDGAHGDTAAVMAKVDYWHVRRGAVATSDEEADIAGLLICFEEPERLHPARKSVGALVATGTALLQTQKSLTDLVALTVGAQSVRMSCREARQAMGIYGDNQDKKTQERLPLLVPNMPKRNAHVRDATIVALAGFQKWRQPGLFGGTSS